MLPWESNDETKSILSQELMERILALSLHEDNFLVAPQDYSLLDIPFEFESFVPVALKLLEVDPNLARAHAKLSPLFPGDESRFWKFYYMRIIYLRAHTGE